MVYFCICTNQHKMKRLKKILYCAIFRINTVLILFLCANIVSSSVDIKDIAKNLRQDLEVIKNEELCVPYITKLYSNKNYIKYISNSIDVNKNVEAMAKKLEEKITDVFSSLKSAIRILEDNKSVLNITNIPSTFIPCLQETSDRDLEAINLLSNGFMTDNNTFIGQLDAGYILQKMRRNITIKNAIKQQYIITNTDIADSKQSPFSSCTGHDDSILWNNFMTRNNYKQRNIILLLDHGGSLSKKQFNIVKNIAKQMILSLNKNDKIALLGIASDWFSLEDSSDCLIPNEIPKTVKLLPNLNYAENSHKQTLYKFVGSLTRGNGATNHSLGIEQALKIVKKESESLKNETIMILYVSRGLLSSLVEAKTVLETIASYTNNLQTDLIINTCAVIDETKPVMYETHFLRDIAEQNYSKYNISFLNNIYRNIGTMISLNSSDSVGYAVSRFYNSFNLNLSFNLEKKISMPIWDSVSSDLTVSFSVGWASSNTFSIIGADIFFSNIAEDVTYYSSNQQHSYAILMDLNGIVLMHPSLPRPSTVSHQLSFANISRFEKIHNVELLKNRLLSEERGEFLAVEENTTNKIKYVWHRVSDWYIICIVINSMYSSTNRPFKAILYPSPSNTKLFYQNLDRTDDYKLCKHLNQLATLDAASLYLSMSCFKSPFYASKTSQDKLIIQGYLAYLKDETRLLVNPGLKNEVRDEVVALAHVIEFLRHRHLESEISKYVVRRYASSYSGVLQMFPGSMLGPGLEPTKRPWFLRSLQHRDKIIMIPPYLDGGGAGYIVTIAYATSEAVVAMDITYGYIYKKLLEYMPVCIEEKITCFLMDDQGYLIYHPSLMDVNGARPVEQQHIIHKESLVANDILNQKHFIRKLLCNNYGDSTIQRYYRLNTSFSDILINSVPGEHCISYKITTIPNTNAFIGVVNATCDVVATFCPCSVVDRLCLNCNRMEQKECECPCECPLNIDTEVCRNVNKNITDNQACVWYSEEVSIHATFIEETERQLDSCFPVNCQDERNYIDCLGLTGCEWCKYDVEGNFLRKPFCSSISTCFNGVLGGITPYKVSVNDIVIPVDTDFSPIGPILGSVIAMCILFILLFVCYRSYTSPSSTRLYLSSTQENQLRMSDINVNDNYHDLGNHRDKLLQEDRPNPVSPYCVASTYRRNTAPADSDHGYSTMTPHDESEHLSLAPVEGDSLEEDFTSDNASVHTSVSAKHNILTPPMFTRISNKNCIVVPVTVHRNMEAT